MGEGGYLALVNGTAYTWRKSDQGSYQMSDWKFPDAIDAGTVFKNYVEFEQKLFTTRSDTRGTVAYHLDGTDCTFRINIRDGPSRIWVEYSTMETIGNTRGSSVELGWKHNGVVNFILSGKPGSFHGSNMPRDWMQKSLSTIGSRPLHQICILGTHDAGMSEVSHSDIPRDIISDYVLTQSTDVFGQLVLGSRYFDIRPQVSGGQMWTGHYTGKVGGRGQSITSIIDAINQFVSQNKELVILNFSHAVQTDDNFRGFNPEDWYRLMDELTRLSDRYIVTDPAMSQDLSLLKLESFIGGGRAAVICVMETDIDLKGFAAKGFYKPSQLNIRNEYADSDDAAVMIKNQIGKMESHMSAGDKRLFLLSWTLTQQLPSYDGNISDFAQKIARFLKPIHTMAHTANKELLPQLLPKVTENAFPNVVYIDYLDSLHYIAFVMAVNGRILRT